MNKKRLLIFICAILSVLAIAVCIILTCNAIASIGPDTDFNMESLRWSIIGAIGGWVGSVFGAIALVISLASLWLPQQVKIKVSISCGMMVSQLPGADKIDAYIITVKNVGMKELTITNVYLHFGNKNNGDIFVGMLNMESILQPFTPQFPIRLEDGGSFDYYLLKDKLDKALAHYEERTSLDTPLSIRVDEVTKGTQYYKTKWTLGSFVSK